MKRRIWTLKFQNREPRPLCSRVLSESKFLVTANLCSLLIIELILKNKLTKTAEVDAKGFNCLYYATYYGHLDVVQHLKNIGVPYKKSDNGTTCLHVAVRRNFPKLVEFFLKKLKNSDFDTF